MHDAGEIEVGAASKVVLDVLGGERTRQNVAEMGKRDGQER